MTKSPSKKSKQKADGDEAKLKKSKSSKSSRSLGLGKKSKKSKSSRSLMDVDGEKKKKKKKKSKSMRNLDIPEDEPVAQDHDLLIQIPEEQDPSEEKKASEQEEESLSPKSLGFDADIISPVPVSHEDPDNLEDSCIFDEVPPIGEIVAAPDDDNVSEIGEGMTDIAGGGEDEDADGVIYNPKITDICFDDRGHSGTKDYIEFVRDALAQFPDTEYSPPVYKVIKKKLKGRRFLIRTRRSERTSWREATKPEIIELFGECFNEERRRQEEGVVDDDSENDSSLQDSAKQSEESLSVGEIVNENKQPSPNKVAPRRSQSVTPANAPTPRHSNLQPSRNKSDSFVKQNYSADGANGNQNHHRKSSRSLADPILEEILQLVISECEGAEEYARPYDDVALLQKGISAEQKLSMLQSLASSPTTGQVKEELDKLEDLTKRMKYASMAPMLDSLERIEKHMTEFFQCLAQQASGSSLEVDELDDPPQSQNAASQRRQEVGAIHKRAIPIASESPKQSPIPPEDYHESSSENGRHYSRSESGSMDSRGEGSQQYGDEDGQIYEIDGRSVSSHKGSYLEGEGESESYDGAYREMALTGSFNDLQQSEDGSYPVNEEDESSEEEDGDISYQDDDAGGEDEEISFADVDEDEGSYEEMDEYGNEEDGEESYESLEEGDEEKEGSQSLVDDENLILSNLPDSSSASVSDGHVLELNPNDDDDLSSVGESMPGMYGSESEDSEEEYSEVESYNDDESEPSIQTDTSDSEGQVEKIPEKKKRPSMADTPNPKIEQFFDRLQHLLEVRRKVEERADMMDPSGKFRSLKVKLHSGGIEKKGGKFKKEYQQHNLHDKLIRNLDDLYDAAEHAHTELKRVLDQMICDVKGMDTTCVILPPLKPRDRAYEKAKEEYSDRVPGPPESWLYDVVRSSVVCKSYKQVTDVNKWLGKNVHIVQSKNRFDEPAFNGYRDLLFHVSIPYKNELAHICEIQVHHKDIKLLDEQFGLPKHHEYFRSCFAGPWRAQEDTLDDLAMLNKYGAFGGQLMIKLMKSKDPDQLRLFAGLCREKLDEFDHALQLYRKILLLQENAHGRDHEDLASTYLNIGLVLGAMGDTDESLVHLGKALAIQESVIGTGHIEVAESYGEIGHMLSKKGDFSGALKQYKKALRIREAKLGREHFLVISSLQDIGRVHSARGDFKSAESQYRKALKIQEAVLGDVHSDVARTHALIGRVLCQHGDFAKSMEEHRLALSIRETNLGKNHPMTAESHTDIGIVLAMKSDYEVAEWRHKKALRIREAVRGKEDEECAISLSYLGGVLCKKGDYEGAIKEIKRAQKIRKHSLGMDNPVTALSYIDLGNVYLKKGDFERALKEFRRAKVVCESILGNVHPDTALAYNSLGNALNLRGDHDAALVEHRKALSIYEQVLGKNHPKTATGYQSLADTLLDMDLKDEALIEHRKALAVRANVLAKDHPDTAVSCSRIGTLLSEKGDLVGALVAYKQALAITVSLCGEDHQDSAAANVEVGKILAAQGDLDEAFEEIDQAKAVREATLGKEHVETGRAYSLLGTINSMEENFDEAVENHKRAVAILEKSLGPVSKEVLEAIEKLEMAENQEVETEF